MVRAPQPETIRDDTITVRTPDGTLVDVVELHNNHQRLRRDNFTLISAALQVHVTDTNGSEQARIYELRCYGPGQCVRLRGPALESLEKQWGLARRREE